MISDSPSHVGFGFPILQSLNQINNQRVLSDDQVFFTTLINDIRSSFDESCSIGGPIQCVVSYRDQCEMYISLH